MAPSTRAGDDILFEMLEFFFLRCKFTEQRLDPCLDPVKFGVRLFGNGPQCPFDPALVGQGPHARCRLDPAHTRCKGTFAEDIEAAYLARIPDMCAAAQLAGKIADRYDTHRFPVFFFKQGRGAFPYGLFAALHIYDDRYAVHDLLIDDVFYLTYLLVFHCLEMREIEAHPAGFDKRS